MIVNFYKGLALRTAQLLCTKNISIVPNLGSYIKFSGQYFKVEKILLDIDKLEYNVYTNRIHYDTNR